MTFLSLCSSVYNNTMMWCKVSGVIAPQVVVPEAADGSISPTPLPSQTFPQFPIWLFRVVLWAGCSLPSVTWWEKFQQCAETEGGRREQTHEYTGLCTGLNSDNSSSYCEERDTHTHTPGRSFRLVFIYLSIYLFVFVWGIYYISIEDERSDKKSVHIWGHQKSRTWGKLQTMISIFFCLLDDKFAYFCLFISFLVAF